MATKGRSGTSSVTKYVAEAQARRQKFADGGVPPRSLMGRVRDNLSRSVGDKFDNLRANTMFESATARGVREMAANNGLGVKPAKRDNFANGMDGVQTRQQQVEQLERDNLPPVPVQKPEPVAEKPELKASDIKFSEGTAYVNGPGTSTSDSINAKLSKGEAVLPAKTVQTLGVDTVADLIEATNGKKPKTIGESVRGKFADGGVPDPKKLGGVQAVKGPAYTIPANPKPNLNTDLTKGGVTSFSEAPLPKTPDGVERPAYQRAAVAGDARAAATINMLDAPAKGVGSGSAAAGSAATQAAGTATQAAGTATQPVSNAVEATKTAAKGLGSTVKGWWSNGLDAGKRGVDVAKGGIAAGKDVVTTGVKKAPLIGGLISGGLSAYDDLTDGKPLSVALPKAATRAVYSAAGTAVGGGLGLLGGGVLATAGSAYGGYKGDQVGKIVGNYFFGDPNDSLKDHAVTKFLEDGKNMTRAQTPIQAQVKPATPSQTAASATPSQTAASATPSQTAASATPSQTAASATPSQQKSLGDTVRGVSPVNIADGIKRYDLGAGQSPLYTNLSGAENESFLNAREQALNNDPGWQPPRQPDLPYVDDTTPAGQAENDRRDQMRVANELADYRNQGLAQRATDNKRSMQNQYAYEQIPEGVSDRVRGIMAYRANQEQERAQNEAVARANDPRNVLLSQIQGKLASGGQLTRSGVAALQGVMGDNTHRYATDVGAATSRYGADTSANVSKYATDVGAATAKMHDETARSGQRVASQHNELSNKLAEARLKHDIRRDDTARTAEGDKRFSELIKTSPHVLGVDKDGRPAVDERKLADFATWLKTQSGGVDANGRPQSLSAAMVGMNPDEAGSAMAAANDAFTVHSVFKRHAANNGLHPTTIGDGVPNFTIDNLSLSDPLRNQAGWLSSTRETMSPFSTGKVARMKTAQGTTVAVPLGSLSPEEYNAFVLHSQLINNQRR